MSAFRNKPIDRRRLNKRDRSDLNQSGGYVAQVQAHRRAKAYNAQNKLLANRDQRTTTQTPGTGGFTQGLGIQQQRNREIGQERQASEGLRPDMDNSIYDIYKQDNQT